LRYYNPQTGRYITPDPIGLEGGINLFLYVQGNPVIKSDPLGLQESEFKPHPGFGDPPVSDDAPWGSAFPDPESMSEGWKHGKESGYYKCLLNCMTGGIFAPAVTEVMKGIAVESAERSADYWARRHYTNKYPKWFKAGGKYSEKLVPRYAGKIKFAAKAVNILGWAYFDIEIYRCIKKCKECL
jgi:hypothetical protein